LLCNCTFNLIACCSGIVVGEGSGYLGGKYFSEKGDKLGGVLYEKIEK